MKPLIAAVLAGLLAGCSTLPPTAPPVTSIKEIQVPVPCVKRVPAKPVLLVSTLTEADRLDVQVKTYLSDLTNWERYATELEVEVSACSRL